MGKGRPRKASFLNPPPRYYFSSIIGVVTLLYYPGTVHMIQDFLNSDESRPHKPLLARSACGRHALEVNFSTWIFEPCVNDWNNIKLLERVYSGGGREAKHGEAMSGSPTGTQIWWPNSLEGKLMQCKDELINRRLAWGIVILWEARH